MVKHKVVNTYQYLLLQLVPKATACEVVKAKAVKAEAVNAEAVNAEAVNTEVVNTEDYPLNKNHENLVKFSSEEDQDYIRVREEIEKMMKKVREKLLNSLPQ
jgi:hypothetical protein